VSGGELDIEKLVELYNRFIVAEEYEYQNHGMVLADILFPTEFREHLKKSNCKFIGVIPSKVTAELPIETLPYGNGYVLDQFNLFYAHSLQAVKAILLRKESGQKKNDPVVGVGGFLYDLQSVQQELRILNDVTDIEQGR
jgi:hypothetical protein